MATAFASSSSPQIATFLSSSSLRSNTRSYLSLRTTLLPPPPSISPIKKLTLFRNPPRPILAAAAEDVVVASEDAVVDAADQLVSNTDDGVSTVVSALLFAAFIGLTAITIGVIYLAVTDFLQKREKEKFEKEEAANKSKKKKKKVGRGRAGPRGFGQKVVEYEDDD
ncbi:uncharacterized protein LOC113855322 [Abrus precatorius]|uniref:Uncharacterized protein LOC113855322 n=1 Tax=Abrus precatorius TaxID=3816 RepID=A0A8B8KG27_ABRPR|nr:uncharacterized protein LOC113855322 [Abrus precatorius]